MRRGLAAPRRRREGGRALTEPRLDPATIRAVAFDAYGTLLSWDFKQELRAVLEQQGLVADLDTVAETFVKAFGKVSPWGEIQDEEGKIDRARMLSGPVPEFFPTREIWRRQFELTFREVAIGDAEAGAEHLRAVLSRAPAYPDAFDTVERLATHGYRLGLLSNADEDFVQSAISHNRLRFSVIQSSESLRIYKPNQAAFLALCRRLECAPAQVLYVGDSVQADIGGAQHAGLRSAWVRRSEDTAYPEDQPPPDLEVKALAEVLTALGLE